MDYFGINSPADLPKIKEVLEQEIIEATRIDNQENMLISNDDVVSEMKIEDEATLTTSIEIPVRNSPNENQNDD
jgi:segregation and condensation protein B